MTEKGKGVWWNKRETKPVIDKETGQVTLGQSNREIPDNPYEEHCDQQPDKPPEQHSGCLSLPQVVVRRSVRGSDSVERILGRQPLGAVRGDRDDSLPRHNGAIQIL